VDIDDLSVVDGQLLLILLHQKKKQKKSL
jgi:hypothetical protein